MYRCFHGRSHEYSPDHSVGIDPLNFVFLWTTKFLSYVCGDFVHVSDKSNFERLCNMFPRASSGQNLYALSSSESIATSFTVLNESNVERFALRVAGLCDELELDTVGDRLRILETRHRADLDFANTRSSSPPCFPSCICLFDTARRSLMWLKWLQENDELFIMLNKQRRWFHSSRVKVPSVRMSASWFLVSTYLIWICESKLIQQKRVSLTQLCGFGIRLVVGLLPLILILTAASVSSKMLSKASERESVAFELT